VGFEPTIPTFPYESCFQRVDQEFATTSFPSSKHDQFVVLGIAPMQSPAGKSFAKGFTRNFSVFLVFYKSTTLKHKPKFSTERSTVGQDFDAKLCNSAERTAKAKLRTAQHQQRYAKQ
jgi:hypothetical protein